MIHGGAKTVIVGSGIAATAIAQRLLQLNPKEDILVLEAGTKVPMQDYSLWEHFLVSKKLPYDKYKDLDYPERDEVGENCSAGGTEVPLAGARVITYGGATIHWGGWSLRHKPEDFRLRTLTGESVDWPIQYEDLEPYYGEAEHYIGVSGDSQDQTVPRTAHYPYLPFPFTAEDGLVAEAMKKAGIGFGNLPIARRGLGSDSQRSACQTTGTCKYCPFGARYAATNFLNEMTDWHDFPNFHTVQNAVVDFVVMSSKKCATGVQYHHRLTGESATLQAERVIIAAGAIESGKLLLRSKSANWKNGLGNDNDLVGRNFITHPYFMFTGILPSNPKKLQPEMNFPTLISRHFDCAEEQVKGKFVLIHSPESPSINLARQMQRGLSRARIDADMIGRNLVQLHGMVEVFSRHDNRVTSFDRVNHLGLQETTVDYTKDAGFDARIAEIQARVAKIFANMGAQIAGKPNVSWRADHAACTCRMSDNPSQGSVDRNLLLHGTDNVYVCSNAVFCSLGAVNPTLTLTALALRLGDHLAT